MRVALYYPWIYLTSGAERTIIQLVRGSRHQWTLFTNHYAPAQTFPEFAGLDVRELNRIPVERTVKATALNALKITFQKLPLDGFDALLVVGEGLGDLAV